MSSKLIERDDFPYSRLPFKLLIDKDISHGAIRVYSYLRFRSSQPGDWKFNNYDIKNMLGISKNETIAKYLKELINTNWIERKKNPSTNYYDYIINADNSFSTNARYNELEERSLQSPQAMWLMCQNILKDYSFSIYYSRIDPIQDPTLQLHIKMDENGYFYDLAEEVTFNEKTAKIIWQYLWQERFNDVMTFIKKNRR